MHKELNTRESGTTLYGSRQQTSELNATKKKTNWVVQFTVKHCLQSFFEMEAIFKNNSVANICKESKFSSPNSVKLQKIAFKNVLRRVSKIFEEPF